MNHTQVDYLIIGAGPAGLQLAYFLEKAQRSYLILERGASVGTFFRQYPRHGKLISINKVHTGYNDPEINLRWDWNSLLTDNEDLKFSKYSKEYFPNTQALTNYLEDYSQVHNLNILFKTEVTNITKEAEIFYVSDQAGNQYESKRVIIATGLSKPYIPDVPGIELTENYISVSIEASDYIDQRVLIIGKGNSSFETADNLVSTASLIHVVSPTPIKMAWQTKYVGHLRAVNNNFLDTYQLKSQNGILDAEIIQIKKVGNNFHVSFNYAHANGEQETIVYDRVIACTGFQFDSTIFDDKSKPLLTIHDRFPAQTSEWESMNIKGLYFAGVLMHMRDFKKKQSGFIHGFRHNIQVLHHIFERKYHQIPIPSQRLQAEPRSLAQAILARVNVSAGLWQQTGFLCDVITLDQADQSAQYYKDISRDYVHSSQIGRSNSYFVITLEFGEDIAKIADPFAINRVHKEDAKNANDSAFIHPIIRHYHQNKLIQEHHIIEDLEAEWKEHVHIQPLINFLSTQLYQENSNAQPSLSPPITYPQSIQNSVYSSDNVKALTRKTAHTKQNQVVEQKKIGQFLIEAGLINQAQLHYALSEQEYVNLKLGEIMVRNGWLNQQTVDFFVGELCQPLS